MAGIRKVLFFINTILKALFCLLCSSPFVSKAFAQAGPGGVGENDGSSALIYWMDAGRQTQSLAGTLVLVNDLSGNNVMNSIIGTPQLLEASVNQQNAIQFNGYDQQILTDLFINAALRPNLTVIAVYRPRIVYAGGVWGDYLSGWEGRYQTDNSFNVPRTTNFVGPGFEPPNGHPSGSIPGLFVANEWVISAVVFREDVVNGTQVRVNGSGESVFTTNHDPGAYDQFVIGAGGTPGAAFPFWFDGNIAELMVFSEALSDLDLITIENYLSAKYNILLTSSDLYTGDENIFDYDVAGIGRINTSLVRLSAQGTGMVAIEASSIDANEFLFWGHNNGPLPALETSDVPTGVEARSNRIWYVSEVDGVGAPADVGSIDISFQLSDLGPITSGDLVLLVDTDGDGSFSDETAIGGALNLGNNSYQFQNITSISNGVHFTLGSSNINQTPLPVTLLYFQVSEENVNQLLFTWATATEWNNDHFEIMESVDGFHWQTILTINTKGNSNERLEYDAEYFNKSDAEKTYYKLRQIDTEGSVTDLKIIKREITEIEEVLIFPNPANDVVTIAANDLQEVILVDSYMREVKSSRNRSIPVGDLKAGMYLLYIKLTDRLVVKKLIIETGQ